jgi:hypothetical protein
MRSAQLRSAACCTNTSEGWRASRLLLLVSRLSGHSISMASTWLTELDGSMVTVIPVLGSLWRAWCRATPRRPITTSQSFRNRKISKFAYDSGNPISFNYTTHFICHVTAPPQLHTNNTNRFQAGPQVSQKWLFGVIEHHTSVPSAGSFATPVAGLAVLRRMQLAMWTCTSLLKHGNQLVLVISRVTIAARQLRSWPGEQIYCTDIWL